MKENHLIILRPLPYNKSDLRLALFTEEFEKYAHNNRVSSLIVELEAGSRQRIPRFKTYVNEGSIVNKGIVGEWLIKNSFTDESQLLLFELIIDSKKEHYYRYVSSVKDVYELSDKAFKRLRKTNK